MVAAGLVWSIGQDGTLVGIDPTTGAVDQRARHRRAGQPFPHARVSAISFSWLRQPIRWWRSPPPHRVPPAGIDHATTTTAPVSSPPPVKATDTTGGGLSAGELIAIIAGGAVAVVVAIWLFERRRKGRIDRPD